MRIAILQTDHVLDEFQEQFGDYPAMFKALLSGVRDDLEFVCIDVQTESPSRTDCDAYLITGSRHSVYDELPWIPALVDFLREVLAAKKKILGVCFGHQLMAHFFGGEVKPADAGWAVGVHCSDVDQQTWMVGAEKSVRLLSSHKDQVLHLPDGAQVYASNAFCPIAGFTIGNQVWTIQGHPEFLPDYAHSLMTFRRKILGEAVYAQGLASLSEVTDAALVAEWMMNFVAQDSGATGGDAP
ncbi:MAG: amidotransferase [Pseudomonadales bacterium]|nr:amidotransferase [Pseudomonadales bacterium]